MPQECQGVLVASRWRGGIRSVPVYKARVSPSLTHNFTDVHLPLIATVVLSEIQIARLIEKRVIE